MQNDRFHYRLLMIRENGRQYIQLVKAGKEGNEYRNQLINEIAKIPFEANSIVIGVKANFLDYQFFYGKDSIDMKAIGPIQDGRILSSNWAGGFTGTYLGMYASSNGKQSNNSAIFDWFNYTPIKIKH